MDDKDQPLTWENFARVFGEDAMLRLKAKSELEADIDDAGSYYDKLLPIKKYYISQEQNIINTFKKSKVLISIIFLFTVAVNVMGQNTGIKEKQLVENVVNDLFQGLAELDSQKVKQTCMSDIKLLESGKVWTIDSLLLRVTTRKMKSTDFKRINKLDFIETKVNGNVAWTSYFNKAVITSNGKTITVKWLESIILQREKNSWRIALLHSTEIERTN